MAHDKTYHTEWQLTVSLQSCPFTKRLYDATRYVKCTCECHDNVNIMHFMSCCDNGYILEYRYIDND